jgi:sec-independent protein translocase protein TatC
MAIFSKNNNDGANMSFFEHIDALRGHLFRIAVAIVTAAIVVFINKSFVFDTVLFGPKKADFITYKWMCQLGAKLNIKDLCLTVPNFKIVSSTLSGQFMAHITISFIVGFIIAIPYVFWEIWRFISPALHPKERKAANSIIGFSSLLFLLGAAFGYFFLTPFSISFLADYHVSDEVVNLPTLDEYVDFVTSMVLVTGLSFELPIVMLFLGRVGIVNAPMLKKFRRYALVLVLVLSAIITPSVDMFTQGLVAVPLYALYELSIIVVKRVEKNKAED